MRPLLRVCQHPVTLMLLATFVYAPTPYLVWKGSQHLDWWLFVGTWYLLFLAAHLGTRALATGELFAFTRDVFGPSNKLAISEEMETRNCAVTLKMCRRPWPIFTVGLLMRGSWFLFAAAALLVDPLIVTIIFELWPVLYGLIELSNRYRRRIGKSTRAGYEVQRTLGPLLAAFVAVGLAIWSSSQHSISWMRASTIGIALAAVATTLAAGSTATFRALGKDVNKALGRQPDSDQDTVATTSAIAMAQGIMGALVMIGSLIVMSTGVSLTFAWTGVAWAALAALVQVLGLRLFYAALNRADDPRINTLYYLTPIGAVWLLALRPDVQIGNWYMLVAGLAGLVAVNVVTHLDGQQSSQQAFMLKPLGYRASVIALWLCATTVILRDDILPNGLSIWSLRDYWGMLGLLATVFVLILGFRQARVSALRSEMDLLVTRIHRQLTLLGAGDKVSFLSVDLALIYLEAIDVGRHATELERPYLAIRNLLVAELSTAQKYADKQALSDVLLDVERLVNLRQQGRSFAETTVLSMFALTITVLSLVARPLEGTSSFSGWAQDVASMVVAVAFVFLWFDAFDRRRQVDIRTFQRVDSQKVSELRQPFGLRLLLLPTNELRLQRLGASLLYGSLFLWAVVSLALRWMA